MPTPHHSTGSPVPATDSATPPRAPSVAIPPNVLFARAMAESGMSRTEVAERIGYSASQAAVVSMLASGSMRIPIDKTPAIADALNLDLVPLVLSVLNQAGHQGLIDAISAVMPERLVSEREYRKRLAVPS